MNALLPYFLPLCRYNSLPIVQGANRRLKGKQQLQQQSHTTTFTTTSPSSFSTTTYSNNCNNICNDFNSNSNSNSNSFNNNRGTRRRRSSVILLDRLPNLHTDAQKKQFQCIMQVR